ncbi:actinodefensin-associated protein B [Streptomyces luteogriseus]|uniref:actinodefensin-associated protein B n=2 Tax=Streptomyces luteogriseus TaxID=68233 RepID=UPI0034032AD4
MAEKGLTMPPSAQNAAGSPESGANSPARGVSSPASDEDSPATDAGSPAAARPSPGTAPLPPEGVRLALAEGVRVTRLPFGGAALVDVRSLRLVECAEYEADALDRLLATGRPDRTDIHVQRLAQQLFRSGLLVAVTEPK